MKEEIKLLRKAQKYLNDLQYPGYPFAMNAIVDLSKGFDKLVIIDELGKKYTLDKYLKEFSYHLSYEGLGCTNATKGTWLVNSSMVKHEDYLDFNKVTSDDFYIDNELLVRLYFAFNAALREAQVDKTIKFIWIQHDSSEDYSECKVFRTLGEIKQYIKDYFSLEE